MTFKELDRDKFVVQFDALDPNSEEGGPPILPDKESEDYKLKLYEDQVHLTNALNTFKIAKTTYGMTKDLLKEIGDKTFKTFDEAEFDVIAVTNIQDAEIDGLLGRKVERPFH